MSLGHVYIVLDPVGSARSTFDDDRYYEFMCCDVPKVGQSPGFDHGHDEESRNGRDVNVDIFEGYIRTSERFRVIRVFFGVPESYGNSPGEVVGLNGPYGKGERGPKGWPPPPPWTGPNWTRKGCVTPRDRRFRRLPYFRDRRVFLLVLALLSLHCIMSSCLHVINLCIKTQLNKLHGSPIHLNRGNSHGDFSL